MAKFLSTQVIVGTIGAARLVIGVAFAIAPQRLAAPEVGASHQATLMTRSFAIREAVLGIGGLAAATGPWSSPSSVRTFAVLGLMTDSGDVAAALTNKINGDDRATGPLALAALAVAAGVTALVLDR